MVTVESIQRRQELIENGSSNVYDVATEEIPQRRFGSGVTVEEQQAAIKRREQARAIIQQTQTQDTKASRQLSEAQRYIQLLNRYSASGGSALRGLSESERDFVLKLRELRGERRSNPTGIYQALVEKFPEAAKRYDLNALVSEGVVREFSVSKSSTSYKNLEKERQQLLDNLAAEGLSPIFDKSGNLVGLSDEVRKQTVQLNLLSSSEIATLERYERAGAIEIKRTNDLSVNKQSTASNIPSISSELNYTPLDRSLTAKKELYSLLSPASYETTYFNTNVTRSDNRNNNIQLDTSETWLQKTKKEFTKNTVGESAKEVAAGVLSLPTSVVLGTAKTGLYTLDTTKQIADFLNAQSTGLTIKQSFEFARSQKLASDYANQRKLNLIEYDFNKKIYKDKDVLASLFAYSLPSIGGTLTKAVSGRLALGAVGGLAIGTQAYTISKEGLSPRNLGVLSGDILLSYGATKKGFNILTGAENPRFIKVSGFPRAGRLATEERLLGLKNVPSVTGKGAGPTFYIGEPKYATAGKGIKGYFSVPFSSIYYKDKTAVFRYGDFSINPKRNPTYIFNPKSGNNPFKWTFKKQALLVSDNKYQQIKTLSEYQKEFSKLNLEPLSVTAPKTVRKYQQPEEEIFNLANPETINTKQIKIGYTIENVPIYKQVSPETSLFEALKIKFQARIENYNALLNTKDIYAYDVAQRGLRKFRLLETGSPEGDILDNAGLKHVEDIKRIGRQLSQRYNINLDKRILDAFADVHDINKELNYNFENYKAISLGIKKGYYDTIPSIKGLNPTEKEYLSNLVYYDERPPINLYNIKNRLGEVVKFNPSKLDIQAKLIINADRLARFGRKADPYMIYPLGKTTPSEIIFKTKGLKTPSQIETEELQIKKLESTPYYSYSRTNPTSITYDKGESYNNKVAYGLTPKSKITYAKIKTSSYTPQLRLLNKSSYLPEIPRQKGISYKKEINKPSFYIKPNKVEYLVKLKPYEKKIIKPYQAKQEKYISTPKKYEPPTDTRKILPPILPKSMPKREEETTGFRTFFIRRGKKFFLPGLAPKGIAIRKGTIETRRTLGATFGVEKTGIRINQRDIPNFQPPKSEFREYKIFKGKKISTPNVFIQKRGKRLSTQSEVGEIQFSRRR